MVNTANSTCNLHVCVCLCVCVCVCVCVCLFIFLSLESLMGRDVSVDLFFNEAISSCFYPVKYLVVFSIHCYL